MRGCHKPTEQAHHTLCRRHYHAVRNGDINECPNCGVICDPKPAQFCPQCGHNTRQIREHTGTYGNDSKGWDLKPEPAPQAPAVVAQAVNRVRENITTHRQACENHETNTIQYLIMPMLKGLGWDEHDPKEVIREFKPAGRRRGAPAIAVDIALMDNGTPTSFIEAKRLDREYDPDHMAQLSKYSAYLRDGGTAVLTNGLFWIVCSVDKGKLSRRNIINVADGEAVSVAQELNNAVGKLAISDDAKYPASPTAAIHESVPNPDAIAANLRRYREDEARRRRVPAYSIVNNNTITLIAEQCPTDLRQLREISGVGPATIEQHGDSIIRIIRGR